MMSSTTDQDPFLQVQADVLSQLSTTRSLFTSYLRIRSLSSSSSSSSTSPELSSAYTDLESSLSTLADDLSDLVSSVRAIEADPYRYGIEMEEVLRRKRLVDEVGSEVENMREELRRRQQSRTLNGGTGQGQGWKGKGKGHERRGSIGAAVGVGEDPLSPNIGAGQGGDAYEQFEQQQQQKIMAEQDEQLDDVFQTVGNLRQQADNMGRELEEQAEMLEVVDNLADRVGGRLQTGVKKMGEVMKKNEDRMSSCCIGVLILILIILLILVLVV